MNSFKIKSDFNISININILFFIPATPIRYEITGGNLAGAFAIKNTTGIIYVTGKLDYETINKVRVESNLNININ